MVVYTYIYIYIYAERPDGIDMCITCEAGGWVGILQITRHGSFELSALPPPPSHL